VHFRHFLLVDTSSGYAVTSANITALYNNWGELSRVFAFDGNRKVFYLPQVRAWKSGWLL
jgi:hypothetical protein